MGKRGVACCGRRPGLLHRRVGGAYCHPGRSLLLGGGACCWLGRGLFLHSEGVGPFWDGRGLHPLEILGRGTGTLEVGDTLGGHLGVRTPVL